jgi:hypothetical protein
MDCQPADGRLRLGASSALSDPRSGCLLRQYIRSPRSLAWHSRSSHICTLAMAERICRTADRLDPAGMPGPHWAQRRSTNLRRKFPSYLPSVCEGESKKRLLYQSVPVFAIGFSVRAYPPTTYYLLQRRTGRRRINCGATSVLRTLRGSAMKAKFFPVCAACLLLMGLAIDPANAVTTTYTDSTTFFAAAGPLHLQDFNNSPISSVPGTSITYPNLVVSCSFGMFCGAGGSFVSRPIAAPRSAARMRIRISVML